MGSGSDWLHDMAAESVAMEERGETVLLLVATPLYVETAPPPKEGGLAPQPARGRGPWKFRVYPPAR
ncbi:hypothetical protein [Streptomyces sp. NPDC048462]|uniref:hypothetical protein n=1 Tax=Streptomyces sp. NPDC048462 TaxID=3365555 RepID=UPI003721A9A5